MADMDGTSIKVMIVDDSALVRQAMTEALSGDPNLRVIAAAGDPFDAAAKMKRETPDVILLDIEMPRMDGLTFLRKLMSQHPIPVLVCSTLAGAGTSSALEALDLGAVDVIQKPRTGARDFIRDSRLMLCDAVRAAAKARLRPLSGPLESRPKLTADAILSKSKMVWPIQTTDKVVVVGASTGGTEALRIFLEALPADAPGVVIVQHMPESFTRAFAERLNTLCKVSVAEAKHGDSVLRGRALIAPGNIHLLLNRSGAEYSVALKEGPLVTRHRPSVDVLFRSAAQQAGDNVVGVLMTGMGDDGAKGLLELKQAGAYTIAQDEASCVVFGMPAVAINLGAADAVLPLNSIAEAVVRKCRELTERSHRSVRGA